MHAYQMEITKISSMTTGINIHDFFPDYTCHDYLSLIFFQYLGDYNRHNLLAFPHKQASYLLNSNTVITNQNHVCSYYVNVA